MALSLEEALDVSAALEKRAEDAAPNDRPAIQQKKAMVDFTAYGLFKEGRFGQSLQMAIDGLGAAAMGHVQSIKLSSSDLPVLQKLAATVILDNVFLAQLEKAASDDKHAIEECLLMNRERGVTLLKGLLP